MSDREKLLAIGAWVFMRGAVVAVACALLKLGQYAVRFV
jgi:hypothetical protein